MTTDGDPNSDDTKWDGARIVLGRVADVFRQYEFVTPELLREKVDNYDLLPDLTRETLEDLTREEQASLKKVIQNLAADHFYIEGGPGGLIFY